MEYFDLIKERFSVRSFKEEKLSTEEIEKILNAGHLAPTGCNNQPQRIYVFQSDDALEKLKNCTKCHFNAPNAMLVCYNKDEVWRRKYDGKSSGVVDASIVATHMMLAAANIGVGTTWVMHFDPKAMVNTFEISETQVPVALLVMGYPADDVKPLGLHFESRPISDTVIYK